MSGCSFLQGHKGSGNNVYEHLALQAKLSIYLA